MMWWFNSTERKVKILSLCSICRILNATHNYFNKACSSWIYILLITTDFFDNCKLQKAICSSWATFDLNYCYVSSLLVRLLKKWVREGISEFLFYIHITSVNHSSLYISGTSNKWHFLYSLHTSTLLGCSDYLGWYCWHSVFWY
jgi:hypothetical protein